MALVGIVAVDRNFAIGREGKLPWHYSVDMKFFRAQTTGHVCVMGHNTWRSLGKPLPRRLNVVLSRTPDNEELAPSVIFMRDREAVLSLAGYASGDVFVMGGARTYQIFANDISRWVVTEVPLSVGDADVHMPADFLAGFRELESRELGEGLVTRFYQKS